MIKGGWHQTLAKGALATGAARKKAIVGRWRQLDCAMQGSNLRLLACEASALPLS